MKISDAKLEFQIRRYKWAKLKAAEEIREEFPHFWLFKGGLPWKFYQFAKKLDRREQELFISARLRRSHRDAAATLGETTSPEEAAVEERYFQDGRRWAEIDREIAVRKRKGDPIKFISKSRAQTAMINSFKKAFGGAGLEVFRLRGYSVPFLRMKFGGWIVQTNFGFTGR